MGKNIPKDSLYTASELGKKLGVSARTLRFYESKQLISPARVGNRRIYNYKDHARMQLILRGKRIGFSLDEIKEFLDLYDADPNQIQQIELLHTRIQQRIDTLTKQKNDISVTLNELNDIKQMTTETLKSLN